MRPYGIVVFPETGKAITVQANIAEHGYACRSNDDDDISAGVDYPTGVFYESEHNRDAELEHFLRKYPGVMFCPITLTTGKKTQPSPEASEFTISNRGVLPA